MNISDFNFFNEITTLCR